MEGAKYGFGYPDMKLNFSDRKNRAMTIVELLVVLASVAIMAAVLIPLLAAARHRQSRINCVSNLRQVDVAFLIWEGDNNNLYPMVVSVTNGGAMELIQKGNASAVFQVMSNELSTTKILVCPGDPNRTLASNWNNLTGSNISYFVNADVTNRDYPQMVLDGDANLVVAGKPAKPGLLEMPATAPVAWSGTRHGPWGNIGLGDGGVVGESQPGLQKAFQYSARGTPFSTNRIAIP